MSTSNYFSENIQFALSQLNLEKIVSHLESNYDATIADSLSSYTDALTWYNMVLNNAGDICANFIAPRAQSVDEKGAVFCDGQVTWATETQENMKTLAQAGLLGAVLPRKYGGLNLPISVNTILVEMVSQADASLMNLCGLQDIAAIVYKYGTEEQKNRILPKFAYGQVSGSMALTEPDAGSDLQAVAMRAIEKNGQWYLDGVKRFITNGCGEISLVLARSEPDLKDGRGLSMFLYERDSHMIIRRIEDKLGIHGSPTCELQYNMAPAELVGKRKFGLIKYVMNLMDGARLAVSAQAVGIAQAAVNEALKYASEREQFGKPIASMPAVYQMLRMAEAEVESSRLLLYHAAYAVDCMEMYEHQAEHGAMVRQELKAASSMAGFLTPLTKFTTTEMANKVAYDALQVHGGVGYMKDFTIERLYRDARITNIYEGTTQLQVVAALGGITTNILKTEWEKLSTLELNELKTECDQTITLVKLFTDTVELAKSAQSKEFMDYVGNYLVDMASLLLRDSLFLQAADKLPKKQNLYRFFHGEVIVRVESNANRIQKLLTTYGSNIGSLS